MLSPGQAAVLGACIEGILYGSGMMMFCSTVAILLNPRIAHSVNKPILIAITLMILVSTTHLVLEFVILMTSEDWSCSANAGSLCMAKAAIIELQILLGDIVTLYRLWLVWERSYRPVLVPGLLFISSTILASAYIALSATGVKSDRLHDSNTILLAFITVGLLQAFLSSGMIILRLLIMNKREASYGATSVLSFRPIIRIITESTAVYVAALLTVLMLWWADPTAFEIASNILVPMVPLILCGLTSRVGIHTYNLQRQEVSGDSSSGSSSALGTIRLSLGPDCLQGFEQRDESNRTENIPRCQYEPKALGDGESRA